MLRGCCSGGLLSGPSGAGNTGWAAFYFFRSGSLSPDALGCRDDIKHVNACRICNCDRLPCVHLQTAINYSGEPLTVASDGACRSGYIRPYSEDDCPKLIHFFSPLSISPGRLRGSCWFIPALIGNLSIILPIYYHNNNIVSNVLIDKKIEIWYSIFALKSSDFSIF